MNTRSRTVQCSTVVSRKARNDGKTQGNPSPPLPQAATPFASGLQRNQVAAVAEWYGHRIVAGFVTSSSPVPLKTRRVGGSDAR
ncbi:hypothetical protein TNCV_1884941 [Trichonephila clavipes]|nr:hypothetical protein TNCV_1884941 [Trichonephila clavipes]